jgi:hypothetical protein
VNDRDVPRLGSAERAVLLAPDAVARAAALGARHPEQRWMLCQPRTVRRSFVEEVVDGHGDQERWMLHQDDAVCRSYADKVLAPRDEAPREMVWMLRQPRRVRVSYARDVLDG